MFAIKHTPVWVLPVVTANNINAATVPGENAATVIIINVSVMIVLVLQNLLTNYLHTYFYAKVMRNVEQVENLSSQIFISVLSIALNIGVSLTIVLNSSFTVFVFFAASIPVAVLIRNAFKENLNTRNRNFRRKMEETSVKVMEMVELIPVTRAHALEETETKKLGIQLKDVAKHGFKLDMIQSFLRSVSWASFQIFQVICLEFTGWLAAQGKILPGDVVMYQTYFGAIVNQISGVVTLIPIISKGLESVNSVGNILLSADVEDTGNKKKIKKVDGKPTLIVAHRLSTIKNADKIAVIGDGGMLEFGTYEELMEQRGEFYNRYSQTQTLQCL